MAKRRHLTPSEIKAQCNMIAREKRMAERAPWTAMGIICAYTLLKSEGFKENRILKVVNYINNMDKRYDAKEVSYKELQDKLMDKAEWSYDSEEYTLADIKARKGSFQYWLDSIQIEPQNMMNRQATRYMLFFYSAMIDLYGYGKERLTRVREYMDNMLIAYQENRTTLTDWKIALLEETGIVFEQPIDPLTQTSGSMMTGA